jgi:hypothetical protein
LMPISSNTCSRQHPGSHQQSVGGRTQVAPRQHQGSTQAQSAVSKGRTPGGTQGTISSQWGQHMVFVRRVVCSVLSEWREQQTQPTAQRTHLPHELICLLLLATLLKHAVHCGRADTPRHRAQRVRGKARGKAGSSGAWHGGAQ